MIDNWCSVVWSSRVAKKGLWYEIGKIVDGETSCLLDVDSERKPRPIQEVGEAFLLSVEVHL